MDDLSRMLPDAACRRALRRRLLAWYDAHARDLPWRRTNDPYAVWLSEIMLQQTQVETVKPYFERFMTALPTIEALARADEHEVLRLWEGLGYYRRARQLHRAAQIIVAEHGGRFPRDPQVVRRLPGIGRYTAGAILSIAFDAREPILEANTLRLLSRLLGLRRRSALRRRPAASLGDGRGPAAATQRRAVQPGTDGIGQRSLHGAGAALPGVPAGRAVSCESAGAAAGDPAAKGQAAGRRRCARRPCWSAVAAACCSCAGPKAAAGRGCGISPAFRWQPSHRCHRPRVGGKCSRPDRRNDRARPTHHHAHARRDTIPHHLGMLRGGICLGRQEDGNPAWKRAGCDRPN